MAKKSKEDVKKENYTIRVTLEDKKRFGIVAILEGTTAADYIIKKSREESENKIIEINNIIKHLVDNWKQMETVMEKALKNYKFELPDRELLFPPFYNEFKNNDIINILECKESTVKAIGEYIKSIENGSAGKIQMEKIVEKYVEQ